MPLLPERLLRAAQRGRLVVVLTEPLAAPPSLPAGVWLVSDRSFLPGAGEPRTAGEIEQGALRRVAAGGVVEVAAPEDWGTARRPTRLRAWFEQLLRRRTVLLVGPPPAALQEHFRGSEETLRALAEQTAGIAPLAPPPLPAVGSRAGLAAVALAGLVALVAWLLLYSALGGAQNWRWTQWIPGLLAAAGVVVALLPLLARAAAGQDLPAPEVYARTLALWSRRPRAPLAVVVLLAASLGPLWLARRHARATFLVLFEPAVVSVEGAEPLGACRAEDPCTLIVPRNSHLHFDGAEGAVCGLDFTASGAILFIDTQQDDCQALPPEDESPPPPRG